MPDQIASHWNAKGTVDSYMPKIVGLFLMPFVTLALFFLFLLIPSIDPLKNNIKKFRKYYNNFVLIIILFLFYIYLLTILWNFNYKFNMTMMMIPVLGVLFIYIGYIMKNLKRNWFIGIRTPWTLSSDKVWDKTHNLGSKLFMLSGIIILIGSFFEDYIFWFIFIPIIITVLWTFIYSYLEWKKIKK